MALKFRLKGLAETYVEHICCPGCGLHGSDDENFATEYTRVTFDGIIVVVDCLMCGEIFVPEIQELEIVDNVALHDAVIKDSSDTGEPLLCSMDAVKLNVEKLNAIRKGEMH